MEIKCWKCHVCRRFQEYSKRIAHKYCSQKCAEKGRSKTCLNPDCQKIFISKTNQILCDQCKNDRGRLWYNKTLRQKSCKTCNKKFDARGRQALCKKCFDKNRKETMVHKYTTISRAIVCKHCYKEYKREEVKLSFRTLPTRVYCLCDECKTKACINKSKINRNRMLGGKNPNYKDGRSISGLHSLIRRRLYGAWTYKVFRRDGFECKSCGSKKRLNAHHIMPLKEIVNSVIKTHCIDCYKNIENDMLERVVDDIIKLHTLEIGITLCESCHKIMHIKKEET